VVALRTRVHCRIVGNVGHTLGRTLDHVVGRQEVPVELLAAPAGQTHNLTSELHVVLVELPVVQQNHNCWQLHEQLSRPAVLTSSARIYTVARVLGSDTRVYL
jgi:hypothetical protein